jgi:superoxide dismutase, Fe-Mn family
MMRFALVLSALALPALGVAAHLPAAATQAAPAAVAFTLAPLPYAADALEPAIDAKTMEIHHGKHHQSYVDNLNKAVAETAALRGMRLEQIVARAGTFSQKVRDNAGGHWNHTFFWETMAPAGAGGEMSPALQQAISAEFGSLDELKAKFKEAGTGQFGSGWVWLIVGADGKLAIASTPNQDNPLMDVAETRGTPILGNDVWEHAYYLKYQNRRGDYLDGWWQVVNWAKVSERHAAARRS